MTPDLAALDAMMEGVTAGPWIAANPEQDPSIVSVEGDGFFIAWVDQGYDNAKANARFIAAARELVPALAAEVRTLRARVEALEGALKYIAKTWPDDFSARHARAVLTKGTPDA